MAGMRNPTAVIDGARVRVAEWLRERGVDPAKIEDGTVQVLIEGDKATVSWRGRLDVTAQEALDLARRVNGR